MNKQAKIDKIILDAFDEDIGSGDITTIASIPSSQKGKAELLLKQDGVLSGIGIAERVFYLLDKELGFIRYFEDGTSLKSVIVIAEIKGNAGSILTAERTALNFLQRMSGIATGAREYAEKVKHTKAVIIDTRKTVPGLRLLDKMAVVHGGCKNHRIGLFDMFLIKDNHIAASGSITRAVEACRKFMNENKKHFKIEVETENLNQVEEALQCKADIIMLDNYSIDKMKEAVKTINGRAAIEASGGVNINTVKEIAETGVDFISVGALTHSVKALDISLEIKLL